jgi:hypothetical protein
MKNAVCKGEVRGDDVEGMVLAPKEASRFILREFIYDVISIKIYILMKISINKAGWLVSRYRRQIF